MTAIIKFKLGIEHGQSSGTHIVLPKDDVTRTAADEH